MRRIALLMLSAVLAWLPAQPVPAQIEKQHAFLLVAQPGLIDPAFSETVVLAVRADDGGPLGVILNRPSTVELRSLYPELGNRRDLIFLGGPIEPDALLFAFRAPAKPARGVFVADDIYISGFSEVLKELLRRSDNTDQQRFFTGFSGWAAGQLEAEIAQGGWYVLPFDATVVFDMNPLTMYQEMVRRATVPRIEAARDAGLARAIQR